METRHRAHGKHAGLALVPMGRQLMAAEAEFIPFFTRGPAVSESCAARVSSGFCLAEQGSEAATRDPRFGHSRIFVEDVAKRRRGGAGRDSVPAPCAVPPPFRWVSHLPASR
jgi:hypothetical protein